MNSIGQTKAALLSILLLMPLGAHADNGFFIGASVGSADLNDDFDGLTIDTSSTAFRLAGGWQFNQHFALEAGYHDFGDFEQQVDINGSQVTVSLSADGFTFGIGGTLPVGDKFSVIGRLGMFFWDGAAEINGVSQASPEDSNLYFGGGASYSLGKSFDVIADWSRYDLEQTESNVFSVGFRYQFGS